MRQRHGRAGLLHARQLPAAAGRCTSTAGTAPSPTSASPPASRASTDQALGLATADFNGDGWIDIYVANDGKENQLWINRRNGTFENTALLSGVALPVTAKAEASMGVDAGDFDDDGDEDSSSPS